MNGGINKNMDFTGIVARASKKSNFLPELAESLGWSAAIALTTLISGQSTAQAANFNFTYAPGTSFEQMLGFEMAGLLWSDYLADDATLNIFVETTDLLPDKVIGGALPGILPQQSYYQFWNAAKQDITTVDDATAHDSLQSISLFSLEFGFDYDAVINGQSYDFNTQMKMTRANAKALGMIDGEDVALDGYILMDNLTDLSLNWNYDLLDENPIQTENLDFLSVALHEIGHTLGFISSVDQPGWVEGLLTNTSNVGPTYNRLDQATPLDMFRMSKQSKPKKTIDLSLGGNPFFSVDGGVNNLANFASGQNAHLGGDGYQASHWQKQDTHLGIMDPVLNLGERRKMTDLDLLAMDIIGWDLQSGGTNLATLHTRAKEQLAQEIGVTVAWMEAHPDAAALLLTPGWLDRDNNNLDDRGQRLHDMIVSSETYEWGWSGYWWGWSGYWWGWSGYWQEQGDMDYLPETAFAQHFSWQIVDAPATTTPANSTPANSASVPEPTSTMGLLEVGLLSIGAWRQRRGDRKCEG